MQQRSENTRNHILTAAEQLFSEFGYDATGVAEICQAAGVSKGAFYHHFPTKQSVFMALLNSYLNGLDAGFNFMRRETSDVPQAILQMAEMVGTLFQSSNIHLPIFLEFWSQARRDPQIWQVTIAPFKRYQAYFAEMIAEGIQQGSLKSIDPQLASRVVVSLAVGLLMESLFDPQVTDWKAEARQSMELLLNGVSRSEQ